uniref:3CxxC-type domain-containing protein n=1 Tax=Biomphalaria glabrata TaxID=6526 RepID=A0A2C9KYH6_BIOGL
MTTRKPSCVTCIFFHISLRQVTNMDAANPPPKTKRKRNRRSRKKTNQNTIGDTNQNSDPENVDKTASKKKGRRRRRRHDDRYYGRFHCKKCNRHWDSAHVYTVAGTKKVKFRQRCKDCEDSWLFPYSLQMLQCSVCGESQCTCKCEDCGKLRHKRFIENDQGELVVNTEFEYCRCEKSRNIPVGQYIDRKKNHRSDLCQKCQKGRPCIYVQSHDSAEDNEP